MIRARNHLSPPGRRGWLRWLVADVVLILLFATIGHASHYGDVAPTGALTTALPFLGAYVLAALTSAAWRQPGSALRAGLPLWFGTVAGGLLIRVLAGETAAIAFQIVAAITLGVFLIAPRVIAVVLHRRRSRWTGQTSSPSPTRQGAPT